MNIYNNVTGLLTPPPHSGSPCDSFIINIVFDPIDEINVCEVWLWADGVIIGPSVRPNQIRPLSVSASGTQQDVEARVFAESPFDLDGEILTLNNTNIIGTYP